MRPVITGPCGTLQSGDAATWLGSVGTLLAFVVALVLLFINVRDRSRAQARLVSGYVSAGRVKHLPGQTFSNTEGKQYQFTSGLTAAPTPGAPPNAPAVLVAEAISFSWVLRNDSDEMLGRTRLTLVAADGSEVAELAARTYVLPKDVVEYTVVKSVDDAPPAPLRAELVFEDAVGRCWERRPGHPLKRIRRRAAKSRLKVPEPVAGTWVPVDPATPHIRRFEV